MSDLSDELARAAAAAAEAGRQAVEPWMDGADLHVEQKSAGLDVVTAADRAVEAAVVQSLRATRPSDGVVGEEGTSAPSGSGVTWIIDPIDSTANFVRGLPGWSISIAAEYEGNVVAGAVASPATNEVFLGSWQGMTINGLPIQVEPTEAPLIESLGVVGWSRSICGERFACGIGRVIAASGRVRSFGGPALGLALTAAGRLDFAYYEQELHPWDYAAGLFLCRTRGLITRDERHGSLMQVLAAPAHQFEELETLAFGSELSSGVSG